MTMKVFLHTRRPENAEGDNQDAEFARIPVVGEYISLPSSDEYWYKVVLVVHIPLTDKGKEFPSKYDAEVYAVGADHLKAQKASGYFSKGNIEAAFD
ncbi:hypothetical protein QUB47_07760 [Microcoleus sp. AT9_B5]